MKINKQSSQKIDALKFDLAEAVLETIHLQKIDIEELEQMLNESNAQIENLKQKLNKAISEFESLSCFPQYNFNYVDLIKELKP